MKKLLTVIALVSLFSCKKENQVPNYHFSFIKDGISKSYSGYIGAHFDTTGGNIELTILGANSDTSYDNYLGIYLNNYSAGNNIGTGQYNDSATNFTLLTTYAINGNESEAGQTVAQEAASNNITITQHFKLNITSMDKTSIKGTFNGDYYPTGNVQNGPAMSITNGDFYVKFL